MRSFYLLAERVCHKCINAFTFILLLQSTRVIFMLTETADIFWKEKGMWSNQFGKSSEA